MNKRMADDESIHKAVKRQDTFWTPTRILMVFFLILGLVGGYAAERYVLHPVFTPGNDALATCQKENRLLSDNLRACLAGENVDFAPESPRAHHQPFG